MSIKLKKQSAASVPTPGSTHVQLYVGNDGLPRIKDSDGADVELSQLGVITLVEQEDPPTAVANAFKVYSKDVGGLTELFFMDDTGQEIQATNDGELFGSGPATDLATTGAPVTVSGAAPPSTGQALLATSSTSAGWSDIVAGTLASADNPIDVSNSDAPVAGQILTAVSSTAAEWLDASGPLTQDPTVRQTSFSASVNTSYQVWTDDSVNKTITLPPTPSEGDQIEITALGSGTDNITINGNGNGVHWGSFQYIIPLTFKGVGFHAFLRWTDFAGGFWMNVADNVTARFGATGGSPGGNYMLVSEDSGRVNTLQVGPNAIVGRIGGGEVSNVLYHTKVLDTNFTIIQSVPEYVANFRWDLANVGELGTNYCFEFHLAVTQASASGTLGFGVWYEDFSSPVLFNATLVRANGTMTHGTATGPFGTVDDSSARSAGGPWETVITGSFRADSINILSLLGKRSAGTTTVLRGSWGRIWKADTI